MHTALEWKERKREKKSWWNVAIERSLTPLLSSCTLYYYCIVRTAGSIHYLYRRPLFSLFSFLFVSRLRLSLLFDLIRQLRARPTRPHPPTRATAEPSPKSSISLSLYWHSLSFSLFHLILFLFFLLMRTPDRFLSQFIFIDLFNHRRRVFFSSSFPLPLLVF